MKLIIVANLSIIEMIGLYQSVYVTLNNEMLNDGSGKAARRAFEKILPDIEAKLQEMMPPDDFLMMRRHLDAIIERLNEAYHKAASFGKLYDA